MKYDEMPEFKKYEYLRDEKLSQLRRFKNDKGYCVFLDGCNATKHHNKDMLSNKGFTYHIFKCGKKIIEKYKIECFIFAIMDEIIFIFPDGSKIENAFDVDCLDLLLTKILSDFQKSFLEYDDCIFKGVVYETKFGIQNAKEIIDFRRLSGHYTALEYFVKEYLEKNDYVNKTPEEEIQSLKRHKLYKKFLDLEFFHDGFEYKTSDGFDEIFDMWSM